MATLEVTITPPEVQEGQGSFQVTFSLVKDDRDIDFESVETSAKFNYILRGFRGNFADVSDDLSGELQGQLEFPGYGSQTITLTPIADGEPESNEPFEVLTLIVQPLVVRPIPPLGGLKQLPTSASPPVLATIIDECFLAGTDILTASGYCPVEELKIGDKVKTFDGTIEEVKWIGKQTRHRFTAHPTRSLPIQIKAGALGDGLPSNNLHVSPDHALLVDGLLINAGALVNDVSIVKTYPEQYTYYHVELANHALLVAEGAPAESFMPNHEDRLSYDNGTEYEELYPNGSNLMLWPMDYPRISSMNKVPRYVRQKLLQIAEELYPKKAA